MGEGFGQEIQPDGDAIERARKCTSLPETTAGGRRVDERRRSGTGLSSSVTLTPVIKAGPGKGG